MAEAVGGLLLGFLPRLDVLNGALAGGPWLMHLGLFDILQAVINGGGPLALALIGYNDSLCPAADGWTFAACC
ncbi:MAG: hypothetical protein ABWU16_05685 [Halothiobacillaceae bacterium]